MWEDAVKTAREHCAHLLVAVLGKEKDLLEKGNLFTKVAAACHTYGEPVPPAVEKNWDFGEHPLIARLASDEERVWSLFRGAAWWQPLSDAFFFHAPLPTDDQAMIATLGGLRKELEKLNHLAWQADEDTILNWAETEGYPADGTIGPDGQVSKADIPEHTQYDTQSPGQVRLLHVLAGHAVRRGAAGAHFAGFLTEAARRWRSWNKTSGGHLCEGSGGAVPQL